MVSQTLFTAPWGRALKVMTAISAGVLIGVAVIGLSIETESQITRRVVMLYVPLGILVVAALFTVRGYELIDNTLRIRRLGWSTLLSLDALVSVEENPNAMRHSIRTFGNGGLFSFTGRYRNKLLGPYRAFATKPELAVVLRFANKLVVVTPDDPGKFAQEVQKHIAK